MKKNITVKEKLRRSPLSLKCFAEKRKEGLKERISLKNSFTATIIKVIP